MSVYAVNGKEPIAAWIPSLDTAGNGTTTLTDLVGSNHGTLTNMDAGTDWVADTSNGGVRALDFDGVNDYVVSGSNINVTGASNRSVSAWVKFDALVNQSVVGWGVDSVSRWFYLTIVNSYWYISGYLNDYDTGVLATIGWHHVVVAYDGTTVTVFVNGASIGSTSKTYNTTAGPLYFGRRNVLNDFHLNGRLDDIRIWNQSLVLADAQWLYNSGAGRARVNVSPDARRRRQSVSGGVL